MVAKHLSRAQKSTPGLRSCRNLAIWTRQSEGEGGNGNILVAPLSSLFLTLQLLWYAEFPSFCHTQQPLQQELAASATNMFSVTSNRSLVAKSPWTAALDRLTGELKDKYVVIVQISASAFRNTNLIPPAKAARCLFMSPQPSTYDN